MNKLSLKPIKGLISYRDNISAFVNSLIVRNTGHTMNRIMTTMTTMTATLVSIIRSRKSKPISKISTGREWDKNTFGKVLIIWIIALVAIPAQSEDWPIYKGNLYFTGNNDEIIVKNNNLKWLFQAQDRIFNPIAVNNKIIFVDIQANLYCLNADNGHLLWQKDMKKTAERYRSLSKAAGKIKYPLVRDNTLYLTDPVAIYAINLDSGAILWSQISANNQRAGGIYADPLLHENLLLYGSRNLFMARQVSNGSLQWSNSEIKTYSGFPTYYDSLVLTQSMDYVSGKYTVYCLDSATGKHRWRRDIAKPFKIFSPVVYQQRVLIPSGQSLIALDLAQGEVLWQKDYGRIITSSPGFTDQSLLMSVDNSDLLVVDANSGETTRTIRLADKSGPSFVAIRDQLYIAYNEYQQIQGRQTPVAKIQAINFQDGKTLWQYSAPEPGAISQPVAKNGIFYLPAGKNLYALGSQFQSLIVQSNRTVPATANMASQSQRQQKPLRKIKVSAKDEQNKNIRAKVTVKLRQAEDILFERDYDLSQPGIIEIPDTDNVEIIASSPGYVPKKSVVGKKDQEVKFILEPVKKNHAYVVDNIYFEYNQSYLKRDSLDILDQVGFILKRNPQLKLRVIGHTDSQGEASYNKNLSMKRAEAVMEYMIKNGISPERLQAIGYGEEKPIADNESEQGRQKNRRTEFVFF